MQLFRTDITLELLLTSSIGRTLTLLLEYAVLYAPDFPELKPLVPMLEQLMLKWKNFVNQMIFGTHEGHDFIKSRAERGRTGSVLCKALNQVESGEEGSMPLKRKFSTGYFE